MATYCGHSNAPVEYAVKEEEKCHSKTAYQNVGMVCLFGVSQLEVEAKLKSLTETNGRLKSQVCLISSKVFFTNFV